MIKKFLVLIVVFVAVAAFATSVYAGQTVVGKWKLIKPAMDRENKPCPFVSEEMELRKDGSAVMSNMPPGMSMRYKTDLTSAERTAVKTRVQGIKGNNIMLMLPPSETDWAQSGMPYLYRVKKSELVLEMPGWTPAVFKKTK